MSIPSRPTAALFVAASVVFLLAVSLIAQKVRPLPVVRPAQRQNPAKAQKAQNPGCWERAGVGKAVIEQRRNINESTHLQLLSVCSDASLTLDQKRERIRDLRKQSQAQISALLTPQQQEEIKECQRAQSQSHPSVPHASLPHPATNDPCANIH